MTGKYELPHDPSIETLEDLYEALREPAGDHLSDGADPAADNLSRAGFAMLGLKAYAERVLPNGGEEPETVIGDLFSDMRHLCDLLGLSFDGLAGQDIHYAAEIEGVL